MRHGGTYLWLWQIQLASVRASGAPEDSFGPAVGLNPDRDMAMATFCTDETTLRTYWQAIVATLSGRLFSKGNWKAIVNIDRLL